MGSGHRLRVMSFNVLHGRSLRDGRVDPDRLARVIAALQPDVLALQEVDRGQPRSGGADLTAVAAEAMGAVDYRFAATLAGTPGGGWTPAEGDEPPAGPSYGVALLSRLPVQQWRLVRLPWRSFPVPVRVPGRWLVMREEPRALLAAVLSASHLPAGVLSVGGTHLSFVPPLNLVQLRRAVAALRELPGPRLLLGDLNVGPGLAGRASGWRSLAGGPTYPAARPRRQLDHVLAEAPMTPVRVQLLELELSDHRAVVVDL